MTTAVPADATTFRSDLREYQRTIDAEITQVSDQLLARYQLEFGSLSSTAMKAYTDLLGRGGKRVRGSLAMYSYRLFGGADIATATTLAVAIEMLHAYMLVIDDIADKSLMRRGGSTAHHALTQYHRQHKLHGEAQHFGESQATNAALAGAHEAFKMIANLDTKPDIALKLTEEINELLVITVQGQFLDIFNEGLQEVAEDQVINALTWKTAYYTFWSPILCGALLAGAKRDDIDQLKPYCINAGLSYQITDDVLGTFGDSFESGKSAMDDIREGKVTLLIARALATTDAEGRRHILAALGNAQLTTDEYEHCKAVIKASGALEYAKEMAAHHATLASKSLDTLTIPVEQMKFLQALSRFITDRSA